MEGGGAGDVSPWSMTSLPSPGLSSFGLCDDRVEELLRFTLSLAASPAADGPHLTLSLSPHYCSRLLQPEPSPLPLGGGGNACGGVPAYPLYTHLARAIRRCIDSGSFTRSASSALASIPLDESAKMKQNDWENLILDKGLELVNWILNSMFKNLSYHNSETDQNTSAAGLKTVDGRCAVGNYNRIAPGSLVLFNKCLLLEVQHVNCYTSFSEMLQVETLAKVLPGLKTIEDGVQIYRKFYTEEKEMSNGVLAITVSKLAYQPYDSLAELLSGLSYDGIASLLGVVHTVGTVPDALPPPRSFLISSSMKPTRPSVKGCSLTDAARALAKHVNRSSNGWWGVLCGSESNKNRLAVEVINRLLNDCCWMNVHLIQPYGCVFEIRVLEGFGARWSKDGLQFIGFLEPYTEEGFLKGWKH